MKNNRFRNRSLLLLFALFLLEFTGNPLMPTTAGAAGAPAPRILYPSFGADVYPETTIRWTPVAPRHAYKLYGGSTGELLQESPPEGVRGSKLRVRLESDQYYVFICRGITAGRDEEGYVWEFHCISTTPRQSSPANGSPRLSPNLITLKWSRVPQSGGYRYIVYDDFGLIERAGDTPPGRTNVTLSGLRPGRTYRWKVRAKTPAANDDFSVLWSFTTRPQ